MIRCAKCGKTTKPKESTIKIEHKTPIIDESRGEPKGSKIVSQEQVCYDCGREKHE